MEQPGGEVRMIARNFPSDIKAGLVESALSENRRVLQFHGEIAAGLDLDHHSRSRGDKVSLRFRFKHMTGTRYVICTVGDSRVPVRLVNEDGTLFFVRGEYKGELRPAHLGMEYGLHRERWRDNRRLCERSRGKTRQTSAEGDLDLSWAGLP